MQDGSVEQIHSHREIAQQPICQMIINNCCLQPFVNKNFMLFMHAIQDLKFPRVDEVLTVTSR